MCMHWRFSPPLQSPNCNRHSPIKQAYMWPLSNRTHLSHTHSTQTRIQFDYSLEKSGKMRSFSIPILLLAAAVASAQDLPMDGVGKFGNLLIPAKKIKIQYFFQPSSLEASEGASAWWVLPAVFFVENLEKICGLFHTWFYGKVRDAFRCCHSLVSPARCFFQAFDFFNLQFLCESEMLSIIVIAGHGLLDFEGGGGGGILHKVRALLQWDPEAGGGGS